MRSIVLQLMNSQAANCGIAKVSLFLFYNLCLFALVSYPVAEIKYPSKFLWLPIPGYSQSLQGNQGNRNLKQLHLQSRTENSELMLVLGFSTFIQASISCPGSATTHSGQIYSLININPSRHAHRSIYYRCSLIEMHIVSV